MVSAGGALLVPDEDLDAARIIEVAALLGDRATLERMRVAARSVGRPGAASVTADLLEALATHAALPDPAAVELASRGAS
jgi:UDP-N-acetylglucosamine:LPS N-acetylglucosamine transferase